MVSATFSATVRTLKEVSRTATEALKERSYGQKQFKVYRQPRTEETLFIYGTTLYHKDSMMTSTFALVRRSVLFLAVIVALTSAVSTGWASAALGRDQVPSATATGAGQIVLLHKRVVHVDIKNLAFGPRTVTVSTGTKVVWTNQDSFQHTATSDKRTWDSGPINAGARFARVFMKPGTYTYHCTIHPFMHGTIKVKK